MARAFSLTVALNKIIAPSLRVRERRARAFFTILAKISRGMGTKCGTNFVKVFVSRDREAHIGTRYQSTRGTRSRPNNRLQAGDVTVAGFFGLFGKRTKYLDDAGNDIASLDSQDNLDDFFLSDDEAKSLGSREEMPSFNADIPSQSESTTQTDSTPVSTSNESPRADSDMDLWRNMARKLKR